MKHLLITFALLTAACSTEPDPSPDGDVGVENDVSAPDVALSDTGEPMQDAGTSGDMMQKFDVAEHDAAIDMSVSDGCDAACRTVDATATVDGSSVTFQRAYFGITSGEFTDSGEPEVHVEVYAGGTDGCPEMNSPSPDQTLIVTGMQLPATSATSDEASGMAVSLLDFAGDVTMAPVLPATGESLTFVAWSCPNCTDDVERYVAFELDAPLEGGQAAGHVFATHCDSLDQ